MNLSKSNLRILIKEIVRKTIQRILIEGPVDRDDNFWVNPQGKVIGPFPHGHVGYVLKVAIPKKQVKLTHREIDYIKRERGSESAWEPMFKRGWTRLRKRKDGTEIDANYDKNRVSQKAKKALIEWIFDKMRKNIKVIYINSTPYTKEEFFQYFE